MNVQDAADLLGVSDVKQEHVLLALRTTYPEIQTLKWQEKTIDAFIENDDVIDLEKPFKHAIKSVNLIPDGFVINKEECELIFFEVEVHSPMSGNKLRQYGKLMIDLAAYGVLLAVLVVNKYGKINEIDLMPYYADWLKEAT